MDLTPVRSAAKSTVTVLVVLPLPCRIPEDRDCESHEMAKASKQAQSRIVRKKVRFVPCTAESHARTAGSKQFWRLGNIIIIDEIGTVQVNVIKCRKDKRRYCQLKLMQRWNRQKNKSYPSLSVTSSLIFSPLQGYCQLNQSGAFMAATSGIPEGQRPQSAAVSPESYPLRM